MPVHAVAPRHAPPLLAARQSFGLLQRGSDGVSVELIGPSAVGPSAARRALARQSDIDRLLLLLDAARDRHRAIGAEVVERDVRGYHGSHMHVLDLKKRKLLERDRISTLEARVRRARAAAASTAAQAKPHTATAPRTWHSPPSLLNTSPDPFSSTARQRGLRPRAPRPRRGGLSRRHRIAFRPTRRSQGGAAGGGGA